jgi:hypothetical protein
MKLKICILGTHHAYQYKVLRPAYLQNLRDLIEMHGVDLVAEETTGMPRASYAEDLVNAGFRPRTTWKNVDLTKDERKLVPDINPCAFGTLLDFDLHNLREWVWIIRTTKAMKHSALLICGLAHTFSVANKFVSLGFDVEVHVYFDRNDEDRVFSVA